MGAIKEIEIEITDMLRIDSNLKSIKINNKKQDVFSYHFCLRILDKTTKFRSNFQKKSNESRNKTPNNV